MAESKEVADSKRASEQIRRAQELRIRSLLALGNGAVCNRTRNATGIKADPLKVSFDQGAADDKIIIIACEPPENGKAKQCKTKEKIKQTFSPGSKSKTFATHWMAPLHPLCIYTLSVNNYDRTSEKDRAKTTVLLNDLCNLALRLFYTGKCKEIVINCKQNTIVDIFSGKNGETMKKFLAWFGLLCAKLMQSNDPQKVNHGNFLTFGTMIECSRAIPKKVPALDKRPVCLLYDETDTYIDLAKTYQEERAEEHLYSESLKIHQLPAEQLYGAPLIEVVKLLDDKSKENQSTEDQTEIVQFVLIPCAATLCFFSYNEEHTEPNKQAEELQNWIAEFFLTKLTKEVSIRKSLLPSQLHRLRLRLALLTTLCYSGLNLEGKDRYSDCIYELLRFACEPKTLLSEYLCLIETCCHERFPFSDDTGNEVAPIGFRYKRYKQIEIQYDFSLHESESDRYKNRKSLLSVKTYSDRQSDILHYSRGDSSMDSSPASSSVMLQGLAEKCQPCQPTEGRVLTAIIYNCDGKRCKEQRVQFWCSSGMQSTGVNECDIFKTMKAKQTSEGQ
uniref:Mab-21 domain-containing protein n=1 Tax=Macrostomum lignano TaxID=282301 RepID=A0A1I8FZJ8_9PLAT